MRKLLPLFIIFLALFPMFSVFGDNIRGDVVKHIILTDASLKETFTMSIEDVFAVSFERNSEFIRGVEIEILIPTSLRDYSGSFAFNIFKKISPEITSGIGTYYGKKYNTFILPDAAKFYIQIPYKESIAGEASPYTKVIEEILQYNDSPLMVTVLPIMKGFPSSIYGSNFTIKISPILKESGNLILNVSIPEDLDSRQLSLNVDGGSVLVKDGKAVIALSAGNHNVSADIPGGIAVNRNVTIQAGKSTEIELDIEKLESHAIIDVPVNTVVYMDGARVEPGSDGRLALEPGQHIVLFKIGDYKISKKFDISPGKDCKISLFLDIFIEEN